jgi:hypothetical protein
MLRCTCVRAPSLRTLTGKPLPTLQQIPSTPTLPPLNASRTTHKSVKCLATTHLVTTLEPARWSATPGYLASNTGRRNHMGRNLQQHPITPTHSPALIRTIHNSAKCLTTNHLASTPEPRADRDTCKPAGAMARNLQQNPIITQACDASLLHFATHEWNQYVLSALSSCGRRRSPPGVRWRSRVFTVARQDEQPSPGRDPLFPHSRRQPLTLSSTVSKTAMTRRHDHNLLPPPSHHQTASKA